MSSRADSPYFGAMVRCRPVDVFSGNVWADTGAAL
jgi:hypothetical protein